MARKRRPNTSPRRTLDLSPHEAVALQRLLGQILLHHKLDLTKLFVSPQGVERVFDKLQRLYGAPTLDQFRDASARARRLRSARREEPPPWLAGYLPKPGDSFWAIFDGDNGGPETHLYVWWFPTRATAREFKRHMDEVYPDRRVSKPIFCRVDQPPKPARARHRSHPHRKPAPSRAKRAGAHRAERDEGLTNEGRRFVVDGKVTYARMEER